MQYMLQHSIESKMSLFNLQVSTSRQKEQTFILSLLKATSGQEGARRSSKNETEKLEGLLPFAKDCHMKVCLLEVRFI